MAPTGLIPSECTKSKRDKQRAAMLSVYYHALGNRLELRSAPGVMVPPDVEPLPLDDALETLSDDRRAFRQALWTIARGIPPQGGAGQDLLARYPRELLDVIGDRSSLTAFEEKRRKYRRAAHMFGEALDLYARQDGETTADFDGFIPMLDREPGFSEAVGLVGALGRRMDGRPHDVGSYLGSLVTKGEKARKNAAHGLCRLAEEVGVPLPTFLEEYASAVAFAEQFDPDDPDEPMTVLPASSVTVQHARSLTTMVTVTALIKTKNLSCVSIGLDPQCWMLCSDAFESTGYVDVDDLRPYQRYENRLGRTYAKRERRMIEEKVRIAWGSAGRELGSFHNLLNVTFTVRDTYPAKVSLEFDLHRCLSSRVLWDVRPGGILLDEGYARARQVAPELFRVTVRKTLRFSDRTPYRGGSGWHDLGQLLNLLAPAAMSWWLESEMYNGVCPKLLGLAEKQKRPTPVPDDEQ